MRARPPPLDWLLLCSACSPECSPRALWPSALDRAGRSLRARCAASCHESECRSAPLSAKRRCRSPCDSTRRSTSTHDRRAAPFASKSSTPDLRARSFVHAGRLRRCDVSSRIPECVREPRSAFPVGIASGRMATSRLRTGAVGQVLAPRSRAAGRSVSNRRLWGAEVEWASAGRVRSVRRVWV
jgi:hypothetical protein